MIRINSDLKASQWRDIDPKQRKLELLAKIALITAGVIALIGIAVGCYYLATTTHTAPLIEHVRDAKGYCIKHIVTGTYEASNAPWMVAPLIITPFAVGSIVGSFFVNMERYHKHGETYTDAWKASRFAELQKKTFPEAYADISQQGGIGPLVRHGVLTIAQGEALRSLFSGYETGKPILDRYTAANAPNLPPSQYDTVSEYRAYKGFVDKMEARWQSLLLGQPKEGESFGIEHNSPLPTAEQAKWRDITPEGRKLELLAKITLAVEVILTFVAIALGLYCLATETRFFPRMLSLCVIIFGSTIAVAFCWASYYLNLERGRRGVIIQRDALWKADRLYLLRNKTFQEVYTFLNQTFDGGIGPLVRHGVLSVDQGERLAALFEDHEESKKVLDIYDKKSSLPRSEYKKIPECKRAQDLADNVAERFANLQREV